jgi:hypothetical protein
VVLRCAGVVAIPCRSLGVAGMNFTVLRYHTTGWMMGRGLGALSMGYRLMIRGANGPTGVKSLTLC